MTNRTNKIQEAIDSASKTKEMIEEMKIEYDEKIRSAGEEGKRIINEYVDKANKEYEDILNKAKENANKIIDEAREEIEIEKKQAIIEIKEEISDLVLRAGEKLIKKNLDNEDNRKIISDFIKDENVA
jgi:F-type H+-transporting ATPase subunit b